MAKRKTHIVSRSAVTGRFVRRAYAKSHPETTVNERIPIAGKER